MKILQWNLAGEVQAGKAVLWAHGGFQQDPCLLLGKQDIILNVYIIFQTSI